MRLSMSGIAALLSTNVVELRFRRRRVKPNFNIERRMLCTNDQLLLNSMGGMHILNYRPVGHGSGLKYNPTMKNLVISWDLLMQDWRAINCNDCDVVSVLQSSPNPDKFWTYFTEKIATMGADQKMVFMNN